MIDDFTTIVIGASAGGLEALSYIIPCFPQNFLLKVIVVQHTKKAMTVPLAKFLDSKSSILVKEANEKEYIQAGTVYIAPGGYHLLIEEDQTFSLSIDPPVSYARPSIDVLFECAADVFAHKLIGVILTGANFDGSQGLKMIKKCGGLTIVQEPATAYIKNMPIAAIEATTVDYILPLGEIGPFLCRFHNKKHILQKG